MNPIKKLLPIEIRKEIKNNFLFLFGKKYKKNILEKNIEKEWIKQKSNTDILNLSIINWDYRIQRPQQIDKILSKKNYRIFYIKNEFELTNSNNFPFLAKKKETNIYEISLTSNKNLFIYTDKPSIKNIEYIKGSLLNLIKTANIKNPIIKIDHPFWFYIVKDLNFPIIYDCMDYHQGFKLNQKDLIKNEINLIKKSNATIVSSSFLYKHVVKIKKNNIFIIRNGVDLNHFKNKNFKNKKNKKIIGYFGAINDWFDEKVIELIAKNNQNIEIILVGKIENKLIEKIAKKYNNISLLGEKKYQEIPEILNSFDICIIPFKLTKLIKATNPVKIYEYFTSGKPVITSKIPELLTFKNQIYFYNKKNILKKIKLAINEKNDKLEKERKEIAKNNSWKTRTIDFEKIINSIKND